MLLSIFSDIVQFFKTIFIDHDLIKAIQTFIEQHNTFTYAFLCLIIFCETGLVVTPFLPGDSLLFAAGAVVAGTSGESLSIAVLIPLLIISALLGDNVNYFIGKFFANKTEDKKLFGIFKIRKDYLQRTHTFYEKHGGKTIIIARFVPIVRTFAPFVAGFGKMNYSRYISFCIIGAISWVSALTLAGYFFGQMEFIKKHFELVVFAIIGISLLPVVVQLLKSRKVKS